VSRLTKRDRHIIAKARELAAVTGGDAIRQYFGDAAALTYDTAQTYGAAFGEARFLLGQLADLAGRLDGDEDQADDVSADTRCLDRIRVVLAKFDWEHDDRQLALEAIERIAEGGQA